MRLLSIQTSSLLFYKALIVLRQLYQFYLPIQIVNIKGMQYIGPLPLNLKVNRSKILVEYLLLLQISIQQPSRILISIQKQYSSNIEDPLSQSQQQIALNLSLVQLLRRVSLLLLVNYSFLHQASLYYSILRYSLILSTYRDRLLFIPIAFYI